MYYAYKSKVLRMYFISCEQFKDGMCILLNPKVFTSRSFNLMYSLFTPGRDALIPSGLYGDMELVKSDESLDILLQTISNGVPKPLLTDVQVMMNDSSSKFNLDDMIRVKPSMAQLEVIANQIRSKLGNDLTANDVAAAIEKVYSMTQG